MTRSLPVIRATGATCLAFVACLAGPACAAPAESGAAPAESGAAPDAAQVLVVVHDAGAMQRLTDEQLAALPAVPLTQPVGHGAQEARFEGPLLWAVLGKAGAIDPAHMHDQTRQTVTLTGQDGYVAVLALGEISPEFEGKQVIVAERMDGAPLGAGHLRVVVPGDHRGGRGVHDLVRITVSAP